MSIDTYLSSSSLKLSTELLKAWAEEFDSSYFKNLEKSLESFLSLKKPRLKTQLSKIISAFEDELLVLVVGAGVSVDYGLPNWDTLLQKLLLSSFQKETSSDAEKSLVLAKLFTKLFSPNPLIAARYLHQHYKSISKGDDKAFEKAVRKALYEKLKTNFESKIFSEIVKFCASPGKNPNLNSIITYNYDDILERHLDELEIDIPYRSISTVGVKPQSGELPIYHVHGYLPRKGKVTQATLVTLSEDVYHKQYTDMYSWNNMVQINKFRDNVCLFVGLSLTDPNIRRLLDIANEQRGTKKAEHYSIRKKYDQESLQQQLETILRNNPELLDEKSRAKLRLDETIEFLVQVIERFETQDDLSFGINTIWVDHYADISILLKAIREKNTDIQLKKPNQRLHKDRL